MALTTRDQVKAQRATAVTVHPSQIKWATVGCVFADTEGFLPNPIANNKCVDSQV